MAIGPTRVCSEDTIQTIQGKVMEWMGHNNPGMAKAFPIGVAATLWEKNGELTAVEPSTRIFEMMEKRRSPWPKVVFHARCGCTEACVCLLCANCKCLMGNTCSTIPRQKGLCGKTFCTSFHSCEEFIAVGEGNHSSSEFEATVGLMRYKSRARLEARKKTRSDATASSVTDGKEESMPDQNDRSFR